MTLEPSLAPAEALGQAMIPYLARPPCLVSFSGGRDSSVILAVATAVARREGLELPVPITQLFPNAPGADESSWQELVIRHVQPPDWIRHVVHDEFDLVGPVAAEVLLEHGVLFPANIHSMLPLLREVRGGSLLTGFDGDSLLRTWRWERAASVLAGRVRPAPRDALRIGLALAPGAIRARRLRRKEAQDLPWLLPEAREAVVRASLAEAAAEPFAWDKRVRWLTRRRYLAVTLESSALLAKQAGAAVASLFLDPPFLASLARAGGTLGFGDLRRLLREQFGLLLPDEIVSRPGKAGFDDVFWGPHSRRLITRWAGKPVPIARIDPSGLHETWSQARPHALSGSALQALWLASHAQQAFDG